MMRRLCPRRLGSFVQANAQRLLLLLSLALLVLCAAINSVKLDADLSSWIQKTLRVDNELRAIDEAIGDGAGANSLLILQAPKKQDINSDILSVESLMIHLEALAIATHVTVDLFDVSWSLKDICFTPELPDHDGIIINQMLDHLMPCAIKTPLDCFWEGSKLLGPEQEVRLSSIGPKLRWTNLNPLLMIEAKRRDHPHTAFPYDALIAWMKRIGIGSGYTERPCLDPSDPNCPISAPNKLSGAAPNIGFELTNGCHGLAAKQMHWKEEEIVGGITRNKSDFIVRASALQSTIQLMGERSIFEYWRKTTKVQDINNWSADKAKLVLDVWQKRFKDELAQFTRSSVASSSYKIQALTPKSMLEPIDSSAILDLNNFELIVAILTLATCVIFPRFESQKTKSSNQSTGEHCVNLSSSSNHLENHSDLETEHSKYSKSTTYEDHEQEQANCVRRIPRLQLILMAILTSLIVVLTFVASLGLSSFMNLPFNMLTTQILPPLALYYGFRQALMIAGTYSKYYSKVPLKDLTTECLNELLPIISLESVMCIVPLIVASVFPVKATRVFTFQALIYIVLSTSTSILLVQALLLIFLKHNNLDGFCSGDDSEGRSTITITYKSSNRKCSRSNSPSILSIKAKKSIRGSPTVGTGDDKPSIEDLIFSRLQEDLRNIRADSTQQPTDINFSAQFKLTTSRSQAREALDNASDDQIKQQLDDENSELPDLIGWHAKKHIKEEDVSECNGKLTALEDNYPRDVCSDQTKIFHEPLLNIYSRLIATKKYIQAIGCLLSLTALVAIMPHSANVKFGLQLRDVVLRGSSDYDSLMMREKYFPVYNIFIITRDDFDYASNQRLLYELHRRIEQVDGVVVQTEKKSSTNIDDYYESKFWLAYFRDWLIELQESFDADRNRSAISGEGWSPDASDTSKLAYKLLAQTGRIDNPIDRSQVEANRLVDKNGLINQKAFYYYLTAWVMNDVFTYSNSEANFRPEPRTWNENVEDLRIERAKPLTYAQMPFLLELSEEGDCLRSIEEIRDITRAFEQLGLTNFPTGIPFIFWDQFINLDLLFIATLTIMTVIYILLASLIMESMNLALILIVPGLVAVAELYSLLGYFSIQFNTIVAVLLMNSLATTTIQTTQFIMNFQKINGDDLKTRVNQILNQEFKSMCTNLVVLLASACVLKSSKIDFMLRYSNLLLCLTAINSFNSLVLTPILLVLFAPLSTVSIEQDAGDSTVVTKSPSDCRDISKVIRSRGDKVGRGKRSNKKRAFARVQSEISLSTISEEAQSEAHQVDNSRSDFSIRC